MNSILESILSIFKFLLPLFGNFLKQKQISGGSLPTSVNSAANDTISSLLNTPTTDASPLKIQQVIDISKTNDAPRLNIPERSSNAMSATDFFKTIVDMPATDERDDKIIEQVLSGNVPAFMRNLKPITINENGHTITYFVSSDVLCIGDNSEFVRVSISAPSCKKLAAQLGCSLITKKMADQIWKNADLKLDPNPMSAPYDISMTYVQRFLDHNKKIELQRMGRSFNIISGHKKDIVICKSLAHPGNDRLAIYGWFYKTSIPIQALNDKDHCLRWSDYSQSFRIVSQKVIVDGVEKNIFDVLKNPDLAHLISNEGPFDGTNIYG